MTKVSEQEKFLEILETFGCKVDNEDYTVVTGPSTLVTGVSWTEARRRILITLLSIGGIVASCYTASAQDKARIAWAALNPAASPMWVIQEKGLLRKLGVDAEIVGINASPIAMQALLAGDLDVIVTSVTTLVTTRLAGADTIMVQTLVPTFVDHIVSLQSITEMSQLKRKTGGVNRVGSTSDLGLRLALRRLGLNPETDTKIITAGGNPERLAALSRGFIQFTIMPEPWVREAEKLGFRDLLDTGSLGIPFHWNAGVVPGKHPEEQAKPGSEGGAGEHRCHSFHQDRQGGDKGDIQQISKAQRPGRTRTGGESLCDDLPRVYVADGGRR